LGSDAFTTLASGHASVSGALVRFDPAALANGFYRLRLSATDISGRSSTTEAIIEAATKEKPAAYVERTTDLTVNLGGAIINVARSYDSLDRERTGSFGHGWHLVNRDSDIQTNVAPTGQESRGVYRPFQNDTRIYLTLPDGRRVAFSFTPEKHEHPEITYYTPAYTADAGVDYRLDSARATLGRNPNGFYDLAAARPYNPASGRFDGPEYTLTAPDGTVYHLSAEDGVVEQRLTNGNRLYFTDNTLISSTGEAVQFVRDAQGRISTLIGPDGTRIEYDYDTRGNLISAHNVFSNATRRYGYAADDAHLLVISTAPAPASGNAIRYGATPQVTPLVANLGGPGQFAGDDYHGTLAAGVADDLAFALRASEIRSTLEDKVFVGVEVTARSGSSLQPAVPAIEGLAPLIERTAVGNAFALFAVSREGLNLLRIAGTDAVTSGAYSLRLFVAGDADQNGDVDGLDAAIVAQSFGARLGDANFLVEADANRDGAIDNADVQLTFADFGFKANRPPLIQATDALTHIDLPVAIDLT
ncbi:MAG: hypothetical protein FJX65_20000, partial [Alphaproteobacteria bacterium]|nr:hypothetical protein [Alphaproteobacteria bacterium]